jgi:hypothetical protein
LLLPGLLPTAAQPASAGTETRLPCADYAEVRRQLGSRYGEAPVSMGLQADGRLVQVFASPRSGSWTIVTTAPSGLACILAAGRSWETAPPPRSRDPAA